MFVCEKCIEEMNISHQTIFTTQSFGPCELCKDVCLCYDLPPILYRKKQHQPDQVEAAIKTLGPEEGE